MTITLTNIQPILNEVKQELHKLYGDRLVNLLVTASGSGGNKSVNCIMLLPHQSYFYVIVEAVIVQITTSSNRIYRN